MFRVLNLRGPGASVPPWLIRQRSSTTKITLLSLRDAVTCVHTSLKSADATRLDKQRDETVIATNYRSTLLAN